MKYLILILIFMVGCSLTIDTNPEKVDNITSSIVINGDKFDVVTIDGCEYIKCGTYRTKRFVYTHKGNCSNPIHKCRCNE